MVLGRREVDAKGRSREEMGGDEEGRDERRGEYRRGKGKVKETEKVAKKSKEIIKV